MSADHMAKSESMETHRKNSGIGINEKLVVSVEKSELPMKSRLSFGLRIKEKMKLLRTRSKYDKRKGRMVITKDYRKSWPQVDHELQVDVGDRPVTARGNRRKEEGKMEYSESPASWWEREVEGYAGSEIYTGSEIEPFEFPWTSPLVEDESRVEDADGETYDESRDVDHPLPSDAEMGSQDETEGHINQMPSIVPLPSDTGTQVHHIVESSGIFDDTDWDGPQDRSSDVGFDQNIRPRVLPYERSPDRTKFLALPKDVGDFFNAMITIYNGNSLEISASQLNMASPFELMQHASILSTSLLLPENRSTTTTIMQELLGLNTTTPRCHRDAEICLALKERNAALLAEIERWLTRLNALRTQLVSITGGKGWEKRDVKRVNADRRWARRLCDEILVVGCNIELKFGGIGDEGREIVLDELAEWVRAKEEEEEVEICEMCKSKNKVHEDENAGEKEVHFSEEQLRVILEVLRKGEEG